MKRVIIYLVFAIIPLFATAFTGEVDIDGVKYNLSTKMETAEAVGLSNPDYAGELVIPGTVVYEGRACRVNIVRGFAACKNITSVKLGEGISTIRKDAFKNCSNLAVITLPSTITSVGAAAFDGTAWLEAQPDGVVYLESIAYTYKGEMSEGAAVELREGTTLVADRCFYDQLKLKKVVFPSTLKRISHEAFFNCSSLESLSLHNVELGKLVFAYCSSLKDLSLINVVTNVKEEDTQGDRISGCFYGCLNIEHVFIDEKVVGTWMEGCPSLRSVELGPQVEEIGWLAFAYCNGLTDFVVPPHVKVIGSHAFQGCDNLASLTISEGVERLDDGAFNSCVSLTKVTIPSSVVSIGSNTFYRCESLASVILPEGLSSIGENAFSEIRALKSFVLPEGLETISPNMFSGCLNLQTVTIPSSVVSIGEYAFNNCPELLDVYCHAAVPPAVDAAKTFKNAGIEYVTLHVPQASLESYRTAPTWQDFKNIVAIEGTGTNPTTINQTETFPERPVVIQRLGNRVAIVRIGNRIIKMMMK